MPNDSHTPQFGDIEDLVLSGKLFAPASRSNSPVRSRSPSPGPAPWPKQGEDFDYDSDAERRAEVEAHIASQQQPDSIGMGPGRTGVKGVIRDRAEAESLARAKRGEEVRDLNRAMEKASLGGKTWGEEDRERRAELARLEGPSVPKSARGGRFGHLREVGVRSFVQSVEEGPDVWVVVHIYDPVRASICGVTASRDAHFPRLQSLDRCAAVDETLSRLARSYPSTKFLRARAGAIGFASSGSKPSAGPVSSLNASRLMSQRRGVPARRDDHSDDEDEDEDDERGDADQWEDDEVDTDVLPTLLVYRGGDLAHSWVRVDWEAKQGLEEFLKRCGCCAFPPPAPYGLCF